MNSNALGQEPTASSRLTEFCESEACQSVVTWLLRVAGVRTRGHASLDDNSGF